MDLEQHDELSILTIPTLFKYFDRGQLRTRPPLLQYIEENFTEVASRPVSCAASNRLNWNLFWPAPDLSTEHPYPAFLGDDFVPLQEFRL